MDFQTAAKPTARDDERALRGLFALCAALAILGTVLLGNVRGPDGVPALWASACIAFYGFAGYRRAPDLAMTEEFADSLYYLGFLLTLVSLVLVLINLAGGESRTVELSVVLPQFGLALATTIVGLLGRMVLVLFRDTGDGMEQRARHRLSHAFDDFADALKRMGEEADAFRVRTREQLETTVTLNQQQLDAALSLSRRHLDAAAEAIGGLAQQAGPLAEAMRHSVQAVETTCSGLTEHTASLDGELRALRSAVTTTAATLTALDERIVRLEVSLGEAYDASLRLTAGLVGEDGEVHALAGQWRARLDELAAIRRALGEEADQAALALARFRRELAGGVRVLQETVER